MLVLLPKVYTIRRTINAWAAFHTILLLYIFLKRFSFLSGVEKACGYPNRIDFLFLDWFFRGSRFFSAVVWRGGEVIIGVGKGK